MTTQCSTESQPPVMRSPQRGHISRQPRRWGSPIVWVVASLFIWACAGIGCLVAAAVSALGA